ncbi:hypothetical protein [Bacillus toyonensis]|uniref:hypothetical protein n=1 Tax=Bacillus toyonensis TaxID=155322 RepID=UPI00211D9AA2|nr:hypothetical protein [Bacillus toyonensis]
MTRFTDITGELSKTIKTAVENGIDVKDRLHELLIHDKNIENVKAQLLEEMPDLAFIIEMVVNKHKEKTFKDTNTNSSLDIESTLKELTVGGSFKTRTDSLIVKEMARSTQVRKEVRDRVRELLVDGKTPTEIISLLAQEFPNGVVIEEE